MFGQLTREPFLQRKCQEKHIFRTFYWRKSLFLLQDTDVNVKSERRVDLGCKMPKHIGFDRLPLKLNMLFLLRSSCADELIKNDLFYSNASCFLKVKNGVKKVLILSNFWTFQIRIVRIG